MLQLPAAAAIIRPPEKSPSNAIDEKKGAKSSFFPVSLLPLFVYNKHSRELSYFRNSLRHWRTVNILKEDHEDEMGLQRLRLCT